MTLSMVTLWSNGIIEAVDETGRKINGLNERFCNVWPRVFKAMKEAINDGAVVYFFIGDFIGGRVPCDSYTLNKFYEDQFEPKNF
jgi:hypothetical protein